MGKTITGDQLTEIAKLIKIIEDSDFKLEHIMVPSGIPVTPLEEEDYVLGHLVAIDGGIWNFEPAS